MKATILTLIFLTMSFIAFGQPNTDTTTQPIQPPSEEDFLKQQLTEFTAKISKLQQELKDASTSQKKINLIQEIEKRQIESVRLSGSFVERFAQGAKASETILSALETGASIGELASPFVSPTFTKNYDNWMERWGKFIPSVALPALAISIKNLTPDQKLISVPIGITITGLISGLNKSESKKTEAIQKSIMDFQSTLDLFDLNRLVYNDVQKLKSYINSANKADSTLSDEFIKFWSENKSLFLKSDLEFISDARYKTYIGQAQIYMSRFQIKLTKIKFVLDFVEGMIKSYYNRDIISSSRTGNANQIQTETKNSLDKLNQTYTNFKNNWEELQGQFYQISPEELHKLDSYYELENLKIQAQPSK